MRCIYMDVEDIVANIYFFQDTQSWWVLVPPTYHLVLMSLRLYNFKILKTLVTWVSVSLTCWSWGSWTRDHKLGFRIYVLTLAKLYLTSQQTKFSPLTFPWIKFWTCQSCTSSPPFSIKYGLAACRRRLATKQTSEQPWKQGYKLLGRADTLPQRTKLKKFWARYKIL